MVSPDFTDGKPPLLTELMNRHIDAALYGLSPPKVTTLYAVKVPGGEQQICRYDDGTGDELKVPIGGTACEPLYRIPKDCANQAVVSGKHMFDILSPEQKSLAVRTKVRYVSRTDQD